MSEMEEETVGLVQACIPVKSRIPFGLTLKALQEYHVQSPAFPAYEVLHAAALRLPVDRR